MINWEAYDLKPLLIEAVCMARDRGSRGEVRVFLRGGPKTRRHDVYGVPLRD